MKFNDLDTLSSDFGKDSQPGEDNVFINLDSSYGGVDSTTSIEMTDWVFTTSNFFKEFRMVKYPSGKTVPTLKMDSIKYTNKCVIDNEKMFELQGEVTSDNFLV